MKGCHVYVSRHPQRVVLVSFFLVQPPVPPIEASSVIKPLKQLFLNAHELMRHYLSGTLATWVAHWTRFGRIYVVVVVVLATVAFFGSSSRLVVIIPRFPARAGWPSWRIGYCPEGASREGGWLKHQCQ